MKKGDGWNILGQESMGIDRKEMIWDDFDLTVYLESKYPGLSSGHTSGLILADDGGILEYMLPSGALSNNGQTNVNAFQRQVKGWNPVRLKYEVSTKLKVASPQKLLPAGPTTKLLPAGRSNNGWIRFLQINRGKYKGLGKDWMQQALKDYYGS